MEEVKKEIKVNTNNYYVSVCPKCKSDKYFEIRRGSDGLFSSSDFSHYKCPDCQSEFKSKDCISVVDSKSVQDLVQAGISGELKLGDMIKEFRKMNIYLLNNKPKEEKK